MWEFNMLLKAVLVEVGVRPMQSRFIHLWVSNEFQKCIFREVIVILSTQITFTQLPMTASEDIFYKHLVFFSAPLNTGLKYMYMERRSLQCHDAEHEKNCDKLFYSGRFNSRSDLSYPKWGRRPAVHDRILVMFWQWTLTSCAERLDNRTVFLDKENIQPEWWSTLELWGKSAL